MGQAKQRGTLEERKALAQPRQKKPSKQEQREATIAAAAQLALAAMKRVGIIDNK